MSLAIGSLFSGIGGLDLGLQWAGLGPVVWQVENDPLCASILARHWPDARRYDDIRAVDPGALAPVDIVCGGFPCTDVSLAGKRAGLAGARSGLWSEFHRIVRGLLPRVVVVENVPGLLTAGFGTVLGDLAACGYAAWWDVLGARHVGAPHRRDRLFIVAWQPGTLGDAHGVGRSGHDGREHGAESAHGRPRVGHERGRTRDAGEDLADARGLGPQEPRPGASRDQRSSAARDGGRLTEPGVGGIADGLPAGLDGTRWPAPPGPQHPWEPTRTTQGRTVRDRPARIRALGNAVVPQVGYVIGCVVRGLMEASP